MLEVIDAVKRVAGVDFTVELSAAAGGRPRADRRRLRPHPGGADWQPHFDDLDTIVRHALAWERKLMAGIALMPAGRPRDSA